MYKTWLKSVARNRSLQGADLRVFLTLMASTQGSTAEISQAEIARDLGGWQRFAHSTVIWG